MRIHFHVLKGCAPAPLANYLKALGILRLVGEQADQQARGWWNGETFHLLTKLSKEELEAFFLEKYEPTPLVSPWNGGSGFFKKDNRKAITAIMQSTAARLEVFRIGIRQANDILAGRTVKPDKKDKLQIQAESVLTWRGSHRDWLAAAYVLDESLKPIYPSLLGTGGNDGRLEFTNNFMQQLSVIIDTTSVDGSPTNVASELLTNALWMEPANELAGASIGQYQPGSAGGANSSTGFASGNLVNPWDFILMMEGSLLITSRATRRLDPNALSRASAPFAVRPHAAGFATPGSEKAQRGEQWMPLWNQPATLRDVTAMYGEARMQLGRQIASRPIDMTRAISRLGVARGIDSFVRYGYLERNGQSTLAVPLGRIYVRQHPQAYLIDDLAGWMEWIQRRSDDSNAPARLILAERRLADAVFSALTHDHTSARWQAILLAAADIEAIQATGTAFDVGPIPSLRPEWSDAVAEDSAEFRLALALGSAAADYFHGKPVDPVRNHWLPLDRGGHRFKTADKRLVNDPRVVASGRDAVRDLTAVVERRLIEAAQKSERRSRLVAASGCGARLGDLAELLAGSLDLDKLLGLARAFMAIQWNRWDTKTHCLEKPESGEMPEEAWLAVRLANLPWPMLGDDRDIPSDPRIIRLLMAGNASRAIDIACMRLRSVGVRPPMQAGVTDIASARLWAAALAFPISKGSAQLAAEILNPSLKGSAHV